MRRRVVRSLVLACSLLLALPQGWCCLFAVRKANASSTTGTPNKATPPAKRGGGCPCCSSSSDPKPDPTDKPSPLQSGTCPCSDRQTILPTVSCIEQVDAGFVV